MAKQRSQWVCQQCGGNFESYRGRCPACQQFGTLVEQVVPLTGASRRAGRGGGAAMIGSTAAVPLPDVAMVAYDRFQTAIDELDRVLGGGIVLGSVVLIGGDPGIGKSTILMQAAAAVAQAGRRVLYVSGEESQQQIKLRADRLGLAPRELLLKTETNLDTILAAAAEVRPQCLIVDSIQTLTCDDLDGGAGSIGQLKECTHRLTGWAKEQGVCTFLIGHVTKDGALAGPRVLEHLVDTVLYLEGERFQNHRLLRAVKNRFGSTNEVGLFVMTDRGFEEVTNPAEVLLTGNGERYGSVITCAIEGSRPFMVEIQALTTRSFGGAPRRVVSGVDLARVQMVSAVLSKRLRFGLTGDDIFVNVTGGLRITEPASDLAIAAGIASSVTERSLDTKTVIFGELGLCGEIRPVGQADRRIAEAARLGFRRVFIPAQTRLLQRPAIEVVEVCDLADALRRWGIAAHREDRGDSSEA